MLHSVCSVLAGAVALASSAAVPAANDVIDRSREVFSTLKSYADTGTLVTEAQVSGAPAIVERHAFRTYFRAPRHFYFEFNEDRKAGDDRYVLWGDDEAFHTWWSATGVEAAYEKGKGALAFRLSTMPTKDSIQLIAPWLFGQAGLEGPLTNLQDATLSGIEDVGGRRCHKVAGQSRMPYGQADRLRPTTVWVDAQTSLICKVVLGNVPGAPKNYVQLLSATFTARANPHIEDKLFLFKPPKAASSTW
jgi:hypothetical protein